MITPPPIAVGSTTLMIVLVLVVVVALPLAGAAFAVGSRRAYRDIGGGRFSMDRADPAEEDARHTAKEEVRQMVEAANFRRERRGEEVLDVDTEVDRLMRDVGSSDPQLREEIRQIVVANNERRLRRGEKPLDVEAEVGRRLREIED